jgi:hypothetical protein
VMLVARPPSLPSPSKGEGRSAQPLQLYLIML